MARVRVGLCCDPALLGSRRRVSQLAREDFVVFPELADGGYAALRTGKTPHRLGDGYLDSFRAASRRSRTCFIAGSTFYRDASSRSTNTSFSFHLGRIVHRYDKVHLFRPTADHRYFSRGRVAGTFRILLPQGAFRAGVVICYDLRFPELIRMMALSGMQILFVPARWPASRDDAWRTLLKARAIENQIFVVGCNAPGREGGPSYAFDPAGVEILAVRGSLRAPVAHVTLDLRRLHKARKLHRNIKDAVVLREIVKRNERGLRV